MDTRDGGLLAKMGTVDDEVHYTYDTGTEPGDRYAGNVVGLYFEPRDEDAATLRERIDRMRTYLEPFRPAHVRFTFELPQLVPDVEGGIGAVDTYGDRVFSWLHTNRVDDRTFDADLPGARDKVVYDAEPPVSGRDVARFGRTPRLGRGC